MIGKTKDLFFSLLGYLLAFIAGIAVFAIVLVILGMLIRFIAYLWAPIIKLFL